MMKLQQIVGNLRIQGLYESETFVRMQRGKFRGGCKMENLVDQVGKLTSKTSRSEVGF